MKRKYIRIFLLITSACILFTGYIKGCSGYESTEQYPPHVLQKDSLTYIDLTDSIIVSAGIHYKKTKLHNYFYGSHYRELWALRVKIKVFDIEKEMGGLKVIKRGGNMQTLSLHLENKEGKKYVLRTVDKDNSMALPSFWKNKILTYMIRDQTAALNPYGALIIPELAQAANVPYTSTKLFFIPYDNKLGEYAELLQGRVAILEEFPDKSWADSEEFGKPENLIGTSDLLYQRYRSQDVIVDEREFARARLFDLFINDWDRHKEQWKWAEHTIENKKVYRPIPRDRDMAFYKFDTGIIPAIVKRINNKFQSFEDEYGDIKGLIKNARYIDGLILNSLSEEEFLSIAYELQKSLTDTVIEEAVRAWPEEVYNLIGSETIAHLKVRRDNLHLAGKEFYKLAYEEVNIAGTDMEEKFIVRRINDNETSVIVKNENGETIYENTFNHTITKKINLYGLRGTDKFILTGETSKGICINIYGGEDHDKIEDKSFVNGYLKKTKVFDSKGDNEIISGEETEDNTTDNPSVLYFDRTGEKRKW
jgi:hypothetical protein